MSVCLCACAHVYVGVFLCYSLPLKSKQGLSLSWSTDYQLTGQQTPKSTSSTSAGVADAHCHAQLFMWVCGIRNQDLMLTLQLRTCSSGPRAHLCSLCPLDHLFRYFPAFLNICVNCSNGKLASQYRNIPYFLYLISGYLNRLPLKEI